MRYNFFHLEQIVEAPAGRRKQSHQYRDVGCRAAKELYDYRGECLECPLPICLEDNPRQKCQKAKCVLTHKAVMATIKNSSVREIAKRLDVSRATVYYHLKKKVKV